MTPSPDPSSAPSFSEAAEARVIEDTVRWLERAVIGLNLCPFARGVHTKGQIHYAVCAAATTEGVLAALEAELAALVALPAQERDTTLLMLPEALSDFLDFNDFLDESDALVESMELAGTVQIASFHPAFRFAGTSEDDASNCTNRAPYPTLHLLREDSVERAVAAFPQAETIYERNIELLSRLGMDGWEALDVGAHRLDAQAAGDPA